MDPVERTSLVVAAESPIEGDAICRFLETSAEVQVVAEVRDVAVLADVVASRGPDVLVLNSRLPGLDDIVATVRGLSLGPSQIVAILSDDLRGRSREVALRQLGVHQVLVGPFDAARLLGAIRRSGRRLKSFAVVGASGGAGQTTVALGLIMAALSLERSVVAVDQGPRRDLSAFIGAHPTLAGHPLLLVADETFRPSDDALVISDGRVAHRPSQSILVASHTFGSRLFLDEAEKDHRLVIDNAGVGDRRPHSHCDLTLPLFRPGLLESGTDLDVFDRRIRTFLSILSRLDKGGDPLGSLSRSLRRPHHFQ